MQQKFNEATTQRPLGNRLIDAQLITIDLPSFIDQIKNERPWNYSDRNAITVFKTNDMRIVLIALREGAEMIRHVVEGMISIQILEGEVVLHTDEQSVELKKGQILALHDGVPHSLKAKEETIFLLTLTTILINK